MFLSLLLSTINFLLRTSFGLLLNVRLRNPSKSEIIKHIPSVLMIGSLSTTVHWLAMMKQYIKDSELINSFFDI